MTSSSLFRHPVLLEINKDGDKVSPGTDISWYVPALRRSVKSELIGLDVSTGLEEKKIVRLLSYHIQYQEPKI
jgi:hypothetical protein